MKRLTIACVGIGVLKTHHAALFPEEYQPVGPGEWHSKEPTYEDVVKRNIYLEEFCIRRTELNEMIFLVSLIAIPAIYKFGRWGGFPKLRQFIKRT
jgi:hypothetical protein